MILSASTSINRYLDVGRGKAVALIALGGATHVATFPLFALLLEEYFHWRTVWTGYGLFVLFVLLPGFWWFLRTHQSGTHARWEERIKATTEQAAKAIQKQWTRAHVLKDWRFYGLASLALVPPFVGTAIVFYQRDLAAALEISPIAFAGSFSFYTFAAVTGSMTAGALIDHYGEKPVLAAFPLVMTAGLISLTSGTNLVLAFGGMALVGLSFGMMQTTGGPLLAHLYGTKHLGSIKALLFSTNILSSALSPFIFGFMMDQGYSMITLLSWVIYYSSVIWILAFPICKGLQPEHTQQTESSI